MILFWLHIFVFFLDLGHDSLTSRKSLRNGLTPTNVYVPETEDKMCPFLTTVDRNTPYKRTEKGLKFSLVTLSRCTTIGEQGLKL